MSLMFREKGVKDVLKQRAPMREQHINEMDIGSIARKTLEGLREQVGYVKGSELVREESKPSIRGFIYNLISGTLIEV